ncbi:TadE/TadG family type IV pilus assembly protein [Proteiniborus sp. DW1]|uniref:TadE/TadG family type IV pilus assembly protein n=1 Tax=Proteiniborus sp. DW1 TaxID=1889883 RepID=UPI0009439AE1|nr:TadE/TadG family type IV pilus assembly protein [Proteiniborus sp. DW1]
MLKKLFKDEEGNALIQTATMLPIIMGLFIGLVFFTNAARYKIVMNMAAKEAAREYQVSMGDTSEAINKAHEELALGEVVGASVSISLEEGSVEIIKPYGFYIPVGGKHLLNLKAKYKFKEELKERYYGTNW